MDWSPHTTVAAVIERDGRFLMVEEMIDDQAVLNQPAGHLEDGESLLQAITREVKEETAWSFTPQSLLGIYQWKHPTKHHTYMRTTFIGSVADHNPRQSLDDGIISANWFSRQQIKESILRSPMVMRNIDDYLAGLSYPLTLLQHV